MKFSFTLSIRKNYNVCITTIVGIYGEPFGNLSGSGLGISFMLRVYFRVDPSPRHKTDAVYNYEMIYLCKLDDKWLTTLVEIVRFYSLPKHVISPPKKL